MCTLSPVLFGEETKLPPFGFFSLAQMYLWNVSGALSESSGSTFRRRPLHLLQEARSVFPYLILPLQPSSTGFDCLLPQMPFLSTSFTKRAVLQYGICTVNAVSLWNGNEGVRLLKRKSPGCQADPSTPHLGVRSRTSGAIFKLPRRQGEAGWHAASKDFWFSKTP